MKKVLFFEKKQNELKDLKRSLSEIDIEVEVLHNYNQIRDQLFQREYDLIVHAYEYSNEHQLASKLVIEEFSFIPYLQISDEPKDHNFKSSYLRRRISRNEDTKALLQIIGNMVHWGRKEKLLKVDEEANILLKQFENSLLQMEEQEFISYTVRFLQNEVHCDNVVWLKNGKVEYYLHELWKVASFQENVERRGKGDSKESVPSYKYLNQESLSDTVRYLHAKLPQGWEKRENPICIRDNQQNQEMLLFPVVVSEEICGHFLLIAPKSWQPHYDGKIYAKFLDRYSLSYKLSQEYTKMKRLSYTDDLTDLYNQRFLGEALDKCIEHSDKNNESFAVMFMDIDHFKRVNDTKGHLVGSRILVELGKIIKQNIRAKDYGFRYGGDEYLVILTNTHPKSAKIVAERIRKQVESTVFEYDEHKVSITISIGIATYPHHAKTKEDVIELADEAMYYGKHKSRNVVFVAS